MNKKVNKIKGMSLIEILIVIAIFAIIGILTTRSVALTIKSAKKSDTAIKVRENINYALSIVERQIRNAESINCSTSTPTLLTYTSLEGVNTYFSCVSQTGGYYLASGSATVRLTSSDVLLTSCQFSCSQTETNLAPVVSVSINAKDANITGVEGSSVSVETEITARNY